MLNIFLTVIITMIFGILLGSCNAAEKVADIVTPAFFNSIINEADSGCAGKKFYSRSAFLEALKSYPKFGTDGSLETNKREIAAFFAHLTHETGQEINGPTLDYCDKSNKEFPCTKGRKYHGRGPIQLTWNFNYGQAGKDIGSDLLNHPEIVGKDPVIAFKTALWHWGENVHSTFVSGKGFGESTRAINGQLECNGGNQDAVKARIEYYKLYCDSLGVSTGGKLFC